MSVGVGDMGVTPFGVRNEGGWDLGYRDLYIQAEEHSGVVHSYLRHYGPMAGYRDETGITGTKAVVGTGGPGITREAWNEGGGWIRRRR